MLVRILTSSVRRRRMSVSQLDLASLSVTNSSLGSSALTSKSVTGVFTNKNCTFNGLLQYLANGFLKNLNFVSE